MSDYSKVLNNLKEIGLQIPEWMAIIGPCGCGGLAWGKKQSDGSILPIESKDGEMLSLCSNCWQKITDAEEKVVMYRHELKQREERRIRAENNIPSHISIKEWKQNGQRRF